MITEDTGKLSVISSPVMLTLCNMSGLVSDLFYFILMCHYAIWLLRFEIAPVIAQLAAPCSMARVARFWTDCIYKSSVTPFLLKQHKKVSLFKTGRISLPYTLPLDCGSFRHNCI